MLLKRLMLGCLSLLIIASLALLWMYESDISVETLKQKYTDEKSQFVDVQGMSVHYKIEGNWSAPTLVLIHGTAASLHTWDGWVKPLEPHFKIIRFDLPAFGLTGPSPARDYSKEAYVSFLDDLMAQLGIERFHLAGNSLGGDIAWNYAATYPDRVDKLVLVDASGFLRKENVPTIFKLARNPIGGQLFKWVTPISLIRQNIEEVYYNDALITDMLVTRYHEFAKRTGNRQAFVDRVVQGEVDRTHQLKNITAPTLIQWGKYDEWIPLSDAYQFDSAIADTSVIEYDAGHIPMEEIPELTANDVLTFLRR